MKLFAIIIAGGLLFGAAGAKNPDARSAGKEETSPKTASRGEYTTDIRSDAPPLEEETVAASGERDEQPAVDGAHLNLERVAYDFGDVPRKGGDLVQEFVFTNDGTVPLVVTRVMTSCSCLKASFSKRPVAPGERGVIRITYEPHKSEPGTFNKVILIYSNSVDGRDVITVQGNSFDEPRVKKIRGDRMKVRDGDGRIRVEN